MALKYLRQAAIALRFGYAGTLGAIGVWIACLGLLLLRAGGSPYYVVLGVILIVTVHSGIPSMLPSRAKY